MEDRKPKTERSYHDKVICEAEIAEVCAGQNFICISHESGGHANPNYRREPCCIYIPSLSQPREKKKRKKSATKPKNLRQLVLQEKVGAKSGLTQRKTHPGRRM